MEADRTESNGTDPSEEATANLVDADDEAAEATADDGSDAVDSAIETGSGDVEPLTITLPDGSESVSEAILSHRRMLTNPSEHGLVSAEEADEVLDTIEALSEDVPEDLEGELAALETSVEGMAERLDRQERQIAELQETVESLAEILGASVEFQHRD